MSEKYSIEELIVRFLQQDINEDELRYLKSCWKKMWNISLIFSS